MANTALQRRRGTTTAHATFAGLPGETTVDTTKNTVVVHDGSTLGGFPLAKETVLTSHIGNTSNPHNVTKAQVGLSNVDNTSDINKPVSTATQTALNGKQDTLNLGAFGTALISSVDPSDAAEQLGLGSAAFQPVSAFINPALSAFSDGTYGINTLVHVNSAGEFNGTPVTARGLEILTLTGPYIYPVAWSAMPGVSAAVVSDRPGNIQFADPVADVETVNLVLPTNPGGPIWDVLLPQTSGTVALIEEVEARIISAVQFLSLTSLSSEDIDVQVPSGCNVYTVFILFDGPLVNRRIILDTSTGTPGVYVKLKYLLPTLAGMDVVVVNTALDSLDVLTTDASGDDAVVEFVKTDVDWTYYSSRYPA